MRSTTGKHYIALDHVRALAAFLVFAWHFLHATNGYPIPFEGAPGVFPLALLDEGHTGVALFMVLSGYLFAKLLDGKQIKFQAFLWNRALRLLPLLALVLALNGVRIWLGGADIHAYLNQLLQGVIFPVLPNGGWSITVEAHFYLILPVILLLSRRSPFLLLWCIAAAAALRFWLFRELGQIQYLAYWTIVGRIDQFILGVMAFQLSRRVAGRTYIALLIALAFTLYWWWFDVTGGFNQRPIYPSPSPIWIISPTIEGAAYAILIAWYDGRLMPFPGYISRFVAKIGEYSYSIYLLHFFVVFRLARLVDEHVVSLDNFYIASLCALFFFVLMIIPGYLSFRFIEGPFLRLRANYIRSSR